MGTRKLLAACRQAGIESMTRGKVQSPFTYREKFPKKTGIFPARAGSNANLYVNIPYIFPAVLVHSCNGNEIKLIYTAKAYCRTRLYAAKSLVFLGVVERGRNVMRKISGVRRFLGLTALIAGLAPGSLAPASAQTATQGAVELPEVEVVATTPLPGGGEEAANKIPAFVQTVPAADFARTNLPNVTDTLQLAVPGAVSIDTNGNDFSQEFYYRGFVASPVVGRPQGLAVYQDGVRVNEAFGDSVNWDLIPPQAIYSADVFTNNPLFGLNALGGAVNLRMKNGFLWQGFETQLMGGSYGRVQGQLQYGTIKDNYSLYISGDALRDGGWRFFSPSTLVRLFGDLGYRTPDVELHLVASGASNYLGVVGTAPVELLDMDWRSVFTNPQTALNQAGSLALNTTFTISPTWTVQSNFYLRSFFQHHVDGNDGDFGDCGVLAGGAPSGTLCDSNNGQPVVNQQGNPIGSLFDATGTFPYGTVAQTRIHANTFGSILQATNKDKIFDHDNQITFGASIDQSWLNYNATFSLGCLNPSLAVVNCGIPGSGGIIQDANFTDYVQTYLSGSTTYPGLYALDTFNLTKELALTAGARFNYAIISTQDVSGLAPELNATNRFQHLNPVVGLTYALFPNLTAYGGYSEANRAPTPLELDCANPSRPCILASTLISDPPLQQVVSHTVEAGLRGYANVPDGQINWKAGYFRTQNNNDIIQLASILLGTGYFTNVPETLRQGVEAGVNFKLGALQAYVNYSFIDATYQFSGTLSSPFNPFANANGDIFVTPGDRIPGIPSQLLKFGADYAFTPQLKIGGDVLIVGSQYYVGDDANQNPKLPAYWVANLHAYYQAADNVQVFCLVNNLFNNHYATYGTFFDLGTNAQFATLKNFTTDPRTVTPAQPLAVYGGVKVTF